MLTTEMQAQFILLSLQCAYKLHRLVSGNSATKELNHRVRTYRGHF